MIFYETERDEKIGVIAAEDILDFFLQKTGKLIYNKGIDDAKELLKEGLEEFMVELEVDLKK